jgi:arylsulfatase A-like enzyme
MYDSLNRHRLPTYGADWVIAPNFKRLAEKAVTFDRFYGGSMPTHPARREMHTGRYNFLHNAWGPMEPYDDSSVFMLKENGIATHLVTDSYHYFEAGGGNFHTKFKTWMFNRGQEGDPWHPDLHDPKEPNVNEKIAWYRGKPLRNARFDWVNRHYMQEEENKPQYKTFSQGINFLEKNHDCDNWFLQIETFDPHEPFFVNKKYLDLYDLPEDLTKCDWPPYGRVEENNLVTPREMELKNAALVSFCDANLGRILDVFDRLDLWKDTMLIINTDHGYLCGEHGWYAKCEMPFYNQLSLLPFFIWDPRSGKKGERRQGLVQTIDLGPTLLEYFNIDRTADMQGKPLRGVVENDEKIRDAGLFGHHGLQVNVTDGQYVYMRGPARPDNQPNYIYTWAPSLMREFYPNEVIQSAELAAPFSFTKGCRIPRFKIKMGIDGYAMGTMLYDNENDIAQEHPVKDDKIEKMMIDHLVRLMKENDAPIEQYERLGLKV